MDTRRRVFGRCPAKAAPAPALRRVLLIPERSVRAVLMVDVSSWSSGFSLASGLISLGLVGFALNAFRRFGDPAMGFVTGAFTVFAVKSFLVAYSLFADLIAHELLELVDTVGDLATVLLLVAPFLLPPRDA